MTEETFLAALHGDPGDETTWLALADCLEENGQPDRAELVRLVRRMRTLPLKPTKERKAAEARIAGLLSAGVRPVVAKLVNSIGMELALIPPGRFQMGSPPRTEKSRQRNETAHEVEIPRPFYLGVYQVTQKQWRTVMGSNPSFFCTTGDGKDSVKGQNTDDFPVEEVSWEDTVGFLDKLSALKKEREAGRHYRLPTEAEWEYSCRGGGSSSTPFHFGHSLSSTQANFAGIHPYGGAAAGTYLGRTCKVGSYRPNAFGLYDMHGNVYEWCSDWYDATYYVSSPGRDPVGPPRGWLRVIRGGCWYHSGQNCRAAYRWWYGPSDRCYYLGLRVAAQLVEQG
jgi:uncharacterized protein (TIGR02996 family)